MSTGTGGYLWACLGGEELWSACLTSQLQGNGHGVQNVTCQDCAPCCADLDKALGYGGGRNIGSAPWYSATDENSTHFAGLLVTEITGLGPGDTVRSVTEAANVGAVLGQARQLAPVITVTGILMGDCCGADYGLAWLRSALKGSCRTGSLCQGDDFKWLTCDPEFPDEDCPANEGQDYEALLLPYIRTMKNVALVSGPTVTNRIPRACPTCDECPLIEVQFVLAAGDPCVYTEAIDLVTVAQFDCNIAENDDCIVFVPSGQTCGCNTAVNCATDPDCVDVTPPQMPSIQSACDHDCLQGDRCRACFDVPAGTFPVNGEGTLVITIGAGQSAMKGVRVRVWNNPLGLDPDSLDECDACSELNVSYIGANSMLVIDGANRTAMITCPGANAVRANQFISSGTGSPAFLYPSMEACGGPYTVCVEVHSPVAAGAYVKATAVGRYC